MRNDFPEVIGQEVAEKSEENSVPLIECIIVEPQPVLKNVMGEGAEGDTLKSADIITRRSAKLNVTSFRVVMREIQLSRC